MASNVEHQIILPLSNPTIKAEATPEEILSWTNGKALVATGSPFDDVEINGKKIRISQCNNAFAFPGIGLGIIACNAKRLTDTMLWAGCKALAKCSPANGPSTPLLPELEEIKKVSRQVAKAVIKQAIEEGLSDLQIDDIDKAINNVTWEAKYYPYIRT